MTYTLGSLFSGYGGLDLGVEAVLGPARVAWVADVCKVDKDGNVGHHDPHRGPCRVLAHRYPDAVNLGDITAVKWTPDCPTCGKPLALYDRPDAPSTDDGRGYYCPRDGWFDLAIRLADPDADQIPEPVDVLTGGSPCQDLSNAGKRGGMTEGTRSNLWVTMREAIAQLRPSLVVWENVRGAYSASADSDLESDSRLLDQVRRRRGEPVLRALGRVAGDLSSLGYVGGWHGIRASDVGAAHQRFRVFLVAYPEGDARWLQHGDGRATADVDGAGLERVGGVRHGPQREPATLLPTPRVGGQGDGPAERRRNSPGLESVVNLLSTPQARDWKGEPGKAHRNGGLNRDLLPTPVTDPTSGNGHARNLGREAQLLPTPSVADSDGGHVSRGGDRVDELLLGGIARQLGGDLLPTPRATDGTKGGPNQRGSSGDLMLPSAVHLLPTPDEWLERRAEVQERTGTRHGPALSVVAWSVQEGLPLVQLGEGPQRVEPGSDRWGPYAAAIHRWEDVMGREAPDPTEPNAKGTGQRLSARFDEWHMGLPDGWVTDVPGITWHEAVKLCGNGVVPRQAAVAVRHLLTTLATITTGVTQP